MRAFALHVGLAAYTIISVIDDQKIVLFKRAAILTVEGTYYCKLVIYIY